MNGLFVLVPCKRGDVLVEYTGRLLTQKEAAASDSEYLLDADKVAHAAQPMVSPSPPDGYRWTRRAWRVRQLRVRDAS